MKRLAALIGCLMLMSSPAWGTAEFNKAWKDHFLGDDSGASDEFKAEAKKAGCNVCHVKKADKKKEEGKNEYGRAVSKFLKAEDFPKEKVKADPEGTRKAILAGIKQANELESADGKKFGEKIENNQLPATDAGL
jgi:cytochrome c553